MRGPAKALVAVVTLLVCLGVAQAVADAPPKVTIDDPSTISYDSVHLSGTVNPEGGPSSTFWRFEYTTTPSEPEAWQPAGPLHEFSGAEAEESTPLPVEESLGGLSSATEYSIRLTATNGAGDNQIRSAVKSFTTDSVNPPQATINPASAVTATTAHFSGTVTSGGGGAGEATTWRFECVPSCPSAEVPHPLEPSDGTDQTVEAEATMLEPGTSYEVTLNATNFGGSAASTDSFTTAAAAPAIAEAPRTSNVSQTGATFTAAIDPNGAATSYHFEYGATTAYGFSVPVPEEAIGAGNIPVKVTQTIVGLDPGQTYNYRLVATNSLDVSESANRSFRTDPLVGPASTGAFPGHGFLPDSRAWELISPVNKNGGNVTTAQGSIRAAHHGDAVLFDSSVAFGDAKGTGAQSRVTYRADRSDTGWSVHSLMPPQDPTPWVLFSGAKYGLASDDLSHLALTALDPPLTSDAPLNTPNLYLTDGNGQPLQLLTPSVHPVDTDITYMVFSTAASPDFKHILFESRLALTTDLPSTCNVPFAECPRQLYEWSDGAVRLAGVLTDPADCAPDPAPCPAPKGSAGGAREGRGAALNNSVSEDGSRVFFTSPFDSDEGEIYLRKEASSTVKISQSEASVPDSGSGFTAFRGASADGSRAFFTSSKQLVDADTDGNRIDLYLYRDGPVPDSEDNLELLSVDGEADDASQDVLGVLGMSRSGKRVYFAAEGQLVDGAPGIPTNRAGLYLWEEGVIKYLATVSAESQGSEADPENWTLQGGISRTSRVTPDGDHLLFSSNLAQAGADTGSCPRAGSEPNGCREFYLYSVTDDQLTCLSCPPSGESPTADARVLVTDSGLTPGYDSHASNFLSAGAERFFFTTRDSLVSADSNGMSDVYQWEREGMGDCSTQGGCVDLISAGTGSSDSYFADATLDGNSAYFVTRDRLSGWDVDTGRDLYVARVGGGLAEPPSAPPICEGDACQPPPATPDDVNVSSASFAGQGNVRTTRGDRRRCARKNQRAQHGKARRCSRKRAAGRARHRPDSNRKVGSLRYDIGRNQGEWGE